MLTRFHLFLLDPAEPGGGARWIDRVRAEGDVVVLGRDVAGAGLGAHGRHAHLLGHLVDGDVDAGMDEAEDGDGLLARHQAAIGGDALLVLAGAVLDRQLDLAAEHAALLVDVLGADLRPALGELAQRRLARRRQRHDHAEYDRLLRADRQPVPNASSQANSAAAPINPRRCMVVLPRRGSGPSRSRHRFKRTLRARGLTPSELAVLLCRARRHRVEAINTGG